MTIKKFLILDIDGCLIDSDHRLGQYLSGDMQAYHDLHVHDTYIEQGVAVYRALMDLPNMVTYFVTAREELARNYTITQLERVISKPFKLLMRPTLDSTHATILKPRLVSEAGIAFEDIFMAVEDQNSMVKRWRELGVVCYQPADGDF
jgi:hypothetical protein